MSIFLDEATSALDDKLESILYDKLFTLLPDSKIISVAHRHTLWDKHEFRLTLLGDGKWDFVKNE